MDPYSGMGVATAAVMEGVVFISGVGSGITMD